MNTEEAKTMCMIIEEMKAINNKDKCPLMITPLSSLLRAIYLAACHGIIHSKNGI